MTEITEIENRVPTSCEVCGRQDATVRYVVYPYVLSFVVITFQRAFAGCWCRLHRMQRWSAASLITASFGWLGIPYGLIFTPFRLFQLAQGGVQDKNLNSQILQTIGRELLRKGNQAGAIRCFESSLMYADETEARETLRKLYGSEQIRDESSISGLIAVIAFFTIPILFASLGVLVGLLDFGVNWFSAAFFPQPPIYLLILIQLPLVLSVFFCVILLIYTLQGITGWARIASAALLALAGIVTSLAFINAIIGGEALGSYLTYLLTGFRESLNEAFITLAAILTRAGLYVFGPESFRNNPTAYILFALILLLSLIFVLLLLIPKIKGHSAQQARLQSLRQSGDQISDRPHIGGWLGLGGFLGMAVLLFLAAPQKSHIDTLEAFDHVNAGWTHMNAGEYELALAEYERAVDLKPNFPVSYLGIGYAHYFSGDLAAAQANFEKALTLWPDSAEPRAGLGWVNLQQGEYELAEQRFVETLQIDPQSLDGHLGLGWVYLSLFDVEKSRKEFEVVINAAPENADAHVGLGTVYFYISDYEGAIKSLNTAIQLNPSLINAYYFKGAVYLKQDKFSDAEMAFRAALDIQPDFYDALNGLGDIQVAKYAFDIGMDYYDKAATLDPKRIEAPLGKAAVLIQMGKFEEAATLVRSLDQDNEYIKPTLSHLYYQMNRKSEADKLLADAISDASQQQNIQQARTYAAVAGVFIANNQFPDAEKYLKLAMDANPTAPDADFYLSLSYVLSALRKFDEAEKALDQASQLGHSDLSLRFARANLLILREDLTGAEREVQAALLLDNNSARAHALLAFIYFQRHTLLMSILEARTAIQFNPYNSYAHSQLAFALQASARSDEALQAAKEAVRINPLDNTAHYILGLCYMDKGLNADAIGEFERFLDTYWDQAYTRDYKIKAEEYLAKLRASP